MREVNYDDHSAWNCWGIGLQHFKAGKKEKDTITTDDKVETAFQKAVPRETEPKQLSRAAHIFLGLLEMLPGVGQITAAIDKAANKKKFHPAPPQAALEATPAIAPQKITPEKVVKRIKEASTFLEKHLDTEGIFRKSAGTNLQNILSSMRKTDDEPLNLDQDDPIDIAVAIKMIIEEAGPVIPRDVYTQLRAAGEDVEAVKALIQNLPEKSRNILKALFDLTDTVASRSEVNKMSYDNLAIVIAPRVIDAAPLELMQPSFPKQFSWIMANRQKLGL